MNLWGKENTKNRRLPTKPSNRKLGNQILKTEFPLSCRIYLEKNSQKKYIHINRAGHDLGWPRTRPEQAQ